MHSVTVRVHAGYLSWPLGPVTLVRGSGYDALQMGARVPAARLTAIAPLFVSPSVSSLSL